MNDGVLECFPAVAAVGRGLVLDPAVASRWDDESDCSGMSVGALAHHLAEQVERHGSVAVRRGLSRPQRSPATISAF